MVWKTLEKEDYIIGINLKGGVFFLNLKTGKQILAFLFPSSLTKIHLVQQQASTYIILKTDTGNFVYLLLEKEIYEEVEKILCIT